MTRVKLMGGMSFVHRPGVFFVVYYPYGASFWTSASCVNLPACGSPYMPLVALSKLYQLCTFSLRLQSIMNYSGIMDVWIMMYYALYMLLLSYKSLTSMYMQQEIMSDITLFICSLTVFKSDIGVMDSPGQFTRLTPTVSLKFW